MRWGTRMEMSCLYEYFLPLMWSSPRPVISNQPAFGRLLLQIVLLVQVLTKTLLQWLKIICPKSTQGSVFFSVRPHYAVWPPRKETEGSALSCIQTCCSLMLLCTSLIDSEIGSILHTHTILMSFPSEPIAEDVRVCVCVWVVAGNEGV